MDQNYRPLQDQAYIHLKNLIMNDELEDGVIYSETKMAKELEISRTPFKAALVRLSQDKYIDIIPSKGFKVHVLSEADIESTYQTRTAIELYCALMIMEQRDTASAAEALSVMKQTVDAMRSLIQEGPDAGETGAFQEQDRLFHSTLVVYAENEEFNRLYEFSIYHQIVTAAKRHKLSKTEKETTCAEHALILEAIRTGSTEACCNAVRQHMETNKANNLTYLRER